MEQIVAIVPLHNPGQRLFEVVQAIPASVPVYLVDDGSIAGLEIARSIVLARDNASLISLGTNRGIAAALNVGLRVARQSLGADGWVLTVDQDSIIPEGYVETAQRRITQSLDHSDRPYLYYPKELNGKSQAVRVGREFFTEPMQSGWIVRISWSRRDWIFDESLFIDGVDTDAFLRLLAEGGSAEALPFSLNHALGEAQTIAGMPVVVHNATRTYYILRNRILLGRRYRNAAPLWWRLNARIIAAECLKIALLACRDRTLVSAGWLGVRHGLAGKTGPAPFGPK